MMPQNKFMLQALKYAFITLAVIAFGVIVLALTGGGNLNLAGRLVTPQERGEVPLINITSAQIAENGVTIPPDTHIIFGVPNVFVPVSIETFFGGHDIASKVRFWVYCYSGNEQANKKAGMIGMKMYDGRFYFSPPELAAQNQPLQAGDADLLALREKAGAPEKKRVGSQMAFFYGGETCYAMIDGDSANKAGFTNIYASMDRDNDGLPDLREQHIGTDRNNPDTDGDGISDGEEVMTTKTSPLTWDTDRDGLSDLCEDKNANGRVDPGETSPLHADTDRDGLCDGDGTGSGCPEARQTRCDTVLGEGGIVIKRECREVITSPVFGEDMNQNCKVDKGETDPTNPETYGITDFQYKLNQLNKK